MRSKPNRKSEAPVIPISKANSGLSDVVNRVAYTGQRVMLSKHGKVIAAIVPVSDVEKLDGPLAA